MNFHSAFMQFCLAVGSVIGSHWAVGLSVVPVPPAVVAVVAPPEDVPLPLVLVADSTALVVPDDPDVPDLLVHVLWFSDHLYSFPAQNANALHSSIVQAPPSLLF